MAAFMVITTLVALLLNAGVTISSVYTNVKNQEMRAAVQQVASRITSQLKSGRLKVSKLLALLNNKNSAALQQYLYSNPLVSKSFQEIQHDTDVIASLQAEANNLENLIAQYTNELASIGYSSSQQGLKAERTKFQSVQDKLDDAVNQHDKLVEKISNTNISPYRDFKVDTSHLDAVSQNINGGTK